MKRRHFLGGLAGGLAARRALAGGLADGCGCALFPQGAADGGPSAAFANVGTKVRITNMKVFGV
jgi:hypothetical protein